MPASKFPKLKIQGVEEIIDAAINLIKKNIIARTYITSDVVTGATTISVANAMQYRAGEEIIFIDNKYQDDTHVHYDRYERARIKSVNNTNSITLYDAIVDATGWLTSNNAFIQKTLGHSILLSENVYYGDRDVIPLNEIAITIEPTTMTNDWMYLQGGLNEEYNFDITVYGKEIKTEDGLRILHKYTDAIKQLFNDNIHLSIDSHEAPLLTDALIGDTVVVVADTQENREHFSPYTPTLYDYYYSFEIQDNKGVSQWLHLTNISYGGGLIRLTFDTALEDNFNLSDFAIIKKIGRYVWDSRVNNISYGKMQKGSAFVRAASLNWFVKSVIEHKFPQVSNVTDVFDEIQPNDSSSSSSSS